MPPSPGLAAGTLQLPQFLQYLKEMGLDARRAMDLLKVKSLSGLNLREALEQLQHILMQEGAPAPMQTPTAQSPTQTPARPPTQAPSRPAAQPQTPMQGQSQPSASRPKPAENNPGSNPANPGPAKSGENNAGTGKPTARAPQSTQSSPTPAPAPPSASVSNRTARPGTPMSSAASPARPATNPAPAANPAAASSAKNTDSEPRPVVLQEGQAPYPVVFDEEDDETELEDFELGEDEAEQESNFGTGVGLSAANRGTAEDIVSRLREAGGASLVSASRLNALRNVIIGQLEPEQLQALIRGVWGAASDKKLKSEQAEALISWGKQDDFMAEALMVLALFEEDANASSNR
jgi:hypothetical protein